MIEGIESIYQRIATAIFDAIPVPWISAKIEAIFYPDLIHFDTEYLPEHGSPRSFQGNLELSRAFRELREKFKDAGQPLWGQACFELWPDGKFNMKWGYENCDENGDTIWNKEEWQRRQEELRQRLMQP